MESKSFPPDYDNIAGFGLFMIREWTQLLSLLLIIFSRYNDERQLVRTHG